MNSFENNVIIRAVPEQDAVPASESKPNFNVFIGLRAPPLSNQGPLARFPIDLALVLDVSSSMLGPKLDLVKRAADFVVDNLGPSDRLSLVSFCKTAQIVLPLCKMTVSGRADAKRAVDSLLASLNTNILAGLTKGLEVLEARTHQNPVASIIFLSDGKDNINSGQPNLHLLPASMRPGGSNSSSEKKPPSIPIHTFGFGSDHDPVTMHDIASLSGGTFSFVESCEMVHDAFAKCIGGLLSVVVRDLRLSLSSASKGVQINSILSGSYPSEIYGLQGSRGEITVGDLYADEKKEFLIDVSVPVYYYKLKGDENEKDRCTPLLDIDCSYKDVASNERVELEFSEIRRPGFVLPSDVKVKVEVERQRNRLNVAEGLAEAQRAAEAGNLEEARAILLSTRTSIRASASSLEGDGLTLQLEAEIREAEEKMGCKKEYEQKGRAYALSSMSAHANQRATTRSGNEGMSGDAYVTANMANMVNKCHQVIKMDDVKKEEE